MRQHVIDLEDAVPATVTDDGGGIAPRPSPGPLRLVGRRNTASGVQAASRLTQCRALQRHIGVVRSQLGTPQLRHSCMRLGLVKRMTPPAGRAPSVEELQAHHVLVPRETGEWQRRARLLQAQWRERRALPIGPWSAHVGDGRVLGSRLPLPDARAHRWNFLTTTIAEQVDRALEQRQRGALIQEDRLYGDLLSSQPLAFNAFGELAADYALATDVWRRLVDPGVTVTDVRFEFSPGRGDPRYTETWWAFDVFVDYRLPDGTRGFTGIEVKYHEDLKQPPKSRSGPNARCVELTGEALPGADLDALWRAPVWQLWLDDLLARSMITAVSTGMATSWCSHRETTCPASRLSRRTTRSSLRRGYGS